MATGQSTAKKMNLTDFMSTARITLGFTAVFLVVVSVVQVVRAIIAMNTPEVVQRVRPMPNYAFQGLPAIRFPAQTDVKPTTYSLMIPGLESGSGRWPMYGDLEVEKVYKLNPMNYSLSTDQKARNIARNLDFTTNPRIIDERTYLFNFPGPPLEENLQVDLKTMFMNLSTNYLSSNNLFGVINASGQKEIPDRVSAIAAVRNYLSTAGILPPDLSDQSATVEYVTSIGNSLEPSQSVLEADYVAVSLPRVGLSGMVNDQPTTYNFYGPDNVSSIYGIVGRDVNGQDVVVELKDYYYALDTSQVGTYVLRPTAEAWENVQAGQGYVINPRGIQNVVIRSVELGYYESHEEQEYLLPIYVFKGDNGVIIYTQAIHPQLLRN